MLTKQSIVSKTIQVGGSTMTSRFLGLAREVLMAKFLGVGPVAEAFITAFKIPNSLRKIFAEGALSVSFVPTIVHIVKKETKEQVNQLILLALLIFEGFLVGLCIWVIWKAELVIRVIAPGWFDATAITYDTIAIPVINEFWLSWQWLSYITTTAIAYNPEQITYAVLFLRILMSFILLLSTSALLTGPLQALNHFFVPAFAPVLLNIVFIIGILVCLTANLSPLYLCTFIMMGGVVQLLLHIFMYIKLGFSLKLPDYHTWHHFKHVWHKFLPCLFSMSVMEIYVFIDTTLASYFPGSIATLYYANRFMLIPLGVIATALSTILLPHFARVGVYAPKRLGFYLLEATKLMTWIMIPISFLMSFVANKIFSTLFLSAKFPLSAVNQASTLLIILLAGLLFFSLNKILLSIYYGLHETKIPMYISIMATTTNIFLSYMLMQHMGPYGIALATTIAGILQTILFVYVLYYKFNFIFYAHAFKKFVISLIAQYFATCILFFITYQATTMLIGRLPEHLRRFFIDTVGFWIWYVPIACLMLLWLVWTRKFFRLSMYFLD